MSAYLKLRGSGPSFLLESAEQGQRVGRWSFLGIRPRALIASDWRTDAYARVSEESRWRLPRRGVAAVRGRRSGAVRVRPRARRGAEWASRSRRERHPDLAVMVTNVLVAFDHLSHEVTVLANVETDSLESSYEEARAHRPCERLRGPVPSAEPGAASARSPTPIWARTATREAVERVKEYIARRRRVPGGAEPALDGRLPRRRLLDLPRPARDQPEPVHVLPRLRGLRVAGASPESLVRVDGAGGAAADRRHPPARGTEADERARELLADPKERAEHVMLVDLGRNDVGRVCEPAACGRRADGDRALLARDAHGLHGAGTLRERRAPLDALRAALPAGTLTGAPKIRAMEIIDELEPTKRGPYGGAIGYSRTPATWTCITIRTTVVRTATRTSRPAPGIVADSDPATEGRETANKAGAVLRPARLARGAGPA